MALLVLLGGSRAEQPQTNRSPGLQHLSRQVRLREAGNITDIDIVAQRADYERAKLDLAEAEANVEMERERLNALMGLWGAQTQWKPVFGLPPTPAQLVAWRGLESLAVRQRPELAANIKSVPSRT